MSRVAIPDWTAQGLLPPKDATSPVSRRRSPYRVALSDVILRFASSDARWTVLNGLLRFRSELHRVGLHRGCQWLNGSFVEDVEAMEGRPPEDIDVVTLYHLPHGTSQSALRSASPLLFDHDHVKANHHVDAYFVQINERAPDHLIDEVIYWYSVWSHRRNDVWKGFLQVDLAPDDDQAAMSLLALNAPQFP